LDKEDGSDKPSSLSYILKVIQALKNLFVLKTIRIVVKIIRITF